MIFKRILFICFSCITFSTLHANDIDSVPQIDSLEKRSLLEKTMNMFEWKIGSSTINSFPAMSFDPSSGLSLGLMQVISIPPKVKTTYNRSTSIVNHFTYSTNNWLNLKSDLILYTPRGININTYVQYLQAPDKYYGIAQDTLNTNPAKFYIKDLEIQGNFSKSIYPTIFTGLVFDISHTYTKSLGVTTEGLIIPAQKNQLLLGFGPYIAFDRRNSVNYPTKGEHITAGLFYYPQHNLNSYTFYTFLLDAKKYMSFNYEFVLATQLYTGSSNGDIPFYNLFQLGGKTRMRGISNKYIFIDDHIYYTQAELRKHVWGRFSAVAFAAVGNTCNSYSDMDFDHLKYVYGGGIRFQTSKTEKLHLRIDYGRGKFGDSGVYITMREAF